MRWRGAEPPKNVLRCEVHGGLWTSWHHKLLPIPDSMSVKFGPLATSSAYVMQHLLDHLDIWRIANDVVWL